MEDYACKEYSDPLGQPSFFNDPVHWNQQQTDDDGFEQKVHLSFKTEMFF
jgi:hypothetical protein